MNLSNNTILLTGGATGIGLALAQRLRQAGSEVIVCGRRADRLREAQGQVPGLHTFGVPVEAFADAVLARLAAGEQEVGYEASEEIRLVGRAELDARFKQMNNR